MAEEELNRRVTALRFWTGCFRFTRRSIWDAVIRIFDFSGRTARAPFWIAFIFFGVAAQFSVATEIWAADWGASEYQGQILSKGLIVFFFCLIVSLYVRRLHDLGMTVWDAINPFTFKFFLVTVWDRGDAESNKFGPPHVIRSHDD
jgi:uncharacterized membrane protein YhaH (DUF805 family)